MKGEELITYVQLVGSKVKINYSNIKEHKDPLRYIVNRLIANGAPVKILNKGHWWNHKQLEEKDIKITGSLLVVNDVIDNCLIYTFQ